MDANGWFKAAHYFYGGGVEIVIWMKNRQTMIRHPNGEIPVNPFVPGSVDPHPDEKRKSTDVLTYEEVGLYYDYQMPGTGWDGDC